MSLWIRIYIVFAERWWPRLFPWTLVYHLFFLKYNHNFTEGRLCCNWFFFCVCVCVYRPCLYSYYRILQDSSQTRHTWRSGPWCIYLCASSKQNVLYTTNIYSIYVHEMETFRFSSFNYKTEDGYLLFLLLQNLEEALV